MGGSTVSLELLLLGCLWQGACEDHAADHVALVRKMTGCMQTLGHLEW